MAGKVKRGSLCGLGCCFVDTARGKGSLDPGLNALGQGHYCLSILFMRELGKVVAKYIRKGCTKPPSTWRGLAMTKRWPLGCSYEHVPDQPTV